MTRPQNLPLADIPDSRPEAYSAGYAPSPRGAAEARRARLVKISQWIYFVTGVVSAFIGIRFILKLLGANEGSAFSVLIYGLSEPFVALFRDLFPTASSGVGLLEPHAVVALVIYSILGWGLVQLTWIVGDR